ncbi:MAG: aromatic ring-hydroxylating dioxygenase subunit alpha [Alphaproteobacteria bacterium]
MFLRNCWYVAAWDHEVKRLETMRRVLLDEPVLLYRDTQGKAVALEDRCCHRHAPLSMGRLRGDRVECLYHGLQFDQTGACVHIPWQDSIPPDARVKSFPVVERDRFVWIWMGDPAKADPALIADFHWLDDPEWTATGDLIHMAGNYMLIVENLLDLSHLKFLHKDSLGTSYVPDDEVPVRYKRDGERVRVERFIHDDQPPGYFRIISGIEREAKVDRWMVLDFSPPSMVTLDIGVQPAGQGAMQGKRNSDVTTYNLNAITPESERSTHYFWAQAQNFTNGDRTLAELDFRLVRKAFEEDKMIIEGQQKNIDLAPDTPRLNIATDGGGLLARQIVDRLIAAEQAA